MKTIFAAFSLLSTASFGVNSDYFSKNYKLLCPDSPSGCSCLDENQKVVKTFFHGMPITGTSGQDDVKKGLSQIALNTGDGRQCFMPRADLLPIYWPSDTCPNADQIKAVPFPSLFTISGRSSGFDQKISGGTFFTTYYTMADESHHEGAKSERIFEAETGNLIATVTKSFRDDLDLEGTGVLSDGRILNVAVQGAGGWSYKILPENTYGLGVSGHYLYPFRSAAVDFEWLCRTAQLGDCTGGRAVVTKRFAGTLLFIPKLQGITLPNGATHDGYICAKDIGGAILNDRLDLFVGPTGGGNPYLKACHFRNAYSDGGVKSLVTWDWRSFRELAPKADGTRVFKRNIDTEYRSISPEKGLEFSVVKDMKCLERW